MMNCKSWYRKHFSLYQLSHHQIIVFAGSLQQRSSTAKLKIEDVQLKEETFCHRFLQMLQPLFCFSHQLSWNTHFFQYLSVLRLTNYDENTYGM
jgi:hypothetical protein